MSEICPGESIVQRVDVMVPVLLPFVSEVVCNLRSSHDPWVVKDRAVAVGSKIHASGREGGWYLISGLGHKISCQTRNTLESLLKVKVASTRT